MAALYIVKDPSGRTVASTPSDWAGLIRRGVNPTGYSLETSGRPVQYFADSSGKNLVRNYVPPSAAQPSQPSSPPPAPPGGNPITPETVIPPLPNIPGLSTPNIPNTPATPQATPINTATVPNTDISPYIPATSQQQQDVINQAITQSQGVANQNVQSLQDIMGKYVQSQMQNWTDPTSVDYQSTMGQLNNFGRADASTFGQSLASRLAPIIGQNVMSLGTNALQPSFTTQQGLVNSGATTQSNLSNASLQRFIDLQNFQKQAELSNQLADKGQPSGLQQGIGAGSSLLSGVGDFMGGLPGLKEAGTSYICRELIKRNLMCESDMDDFHVHIMPAMFKKGRAFWKYAMDGLRLVESVNRNDQADHIWTAFKPLLFDRVMAEPDACRAVDLYANACLQLCEIGDPSLWDDKVYRTSFWDTLPFLPRLLTYKPFLEALGKAIRIRTLIVYDKPRCSHHREIA